MKNKEYFKIKNLYSLNILNEKCKILLNNSNKLNSEIQDFYDFYFLNSLDWLIENQDKINQDFYNNLDKIKFDVIFSNLEDRIKLILNIKDLEEFTQYISIAPFKFLKKKRQDEILKQFNEFSKIKNQYKKLKYFDSIKR